MPDDPQFTTRMEIAPTRSVRPSDLSLPVRPAGLETEQILCDLHEEVDAVAFERAWQTVVDRHGILRTTFRSEKSGELQQAVHRGLRVSLDRKDWTTLLPPTIEQRLEEFLLADRLRGFSLGVAPLLRLTLIRTEPAHYWFVFSFHQFLLAAPGLAMVLKEAFAVYETLTDGKDVRLGPPPACCGYLDWLQRLDWDRAESFWRGRLKGISAPTVLPIVRPALDVDEASGARPTLEVKLTATATARLYAFADANRFTLNTIVRGAWAVLLSRYSGDEEVVLGAVRACGHVSMEGVDDLVGYFINTVPVRVKVAMGTPLLPWLQALREEWLALREQEHTPLAKIHGWSDVPVDQPLFETLVNYQEPSLDALLRGLGGRWKRRHFRLCRHSNYPLVIDASGGPRLTIRLTFDARRVDREAAMRLIGHYRTVIEAMAAESNQKLGDLPLLTDRERHQLLTEWNDTAADYPRTQCVHELFSEQVNRAPDRLAVADAHGRLTYLELDRRSGQLARRLRNLGVRADVVVGIWMERSVEMIVAMLAVLKSGGAFLPLDPGTPPERIAFIQRDARAPIFITQTGALESLSHLAGVKVVPLTPLADNFSASEDVVETPVEVTSRNLAYVIYTSGSTGQPKGVEIEHRSLVNLVTCHQRLHQLTADDRMLQLVSPAFDASIWEIWPTLAVGASLHIGETELRLSPSKLWQWLAAREITLALLPTPLAEALMLEKAPPGVALRALFTGGEKLNRRPPPDFPCALVDLYGPTECTVCSTLTVVEPKTDHAVASSIGRPLFNTSVYVLDPYLRPVPAGVPGELFIGGVGLARGYRHRPELTLEKFIANPFSTEPGARLYRTGDLVRWLSNGELEFLSRLDHQVKIRGHRIELGEIEAILDQHPAIRQAVVTVRDETSGKSLVAHLVAKSKNTPESHELRQFLARKLPDYMLPSRFLWLERMPMTPNGKVDRKALAELPVGVDGERDCTLPRTALEAGLTRLWCRVLGLEQVGINESFFDLGGHSLLATHLIELVRAEFGAPLSVRALFDHPTVAGLAAVVSSMPRVTVSSPAPIGRRSDRRDRQPPSRTGGPALSTLSDETLAIKTRK
jgi:amino acid adenylation domain-containing protein